MSIDENKSNHIDSFVAVVRHLSCNGSQHPRLQSQQEMEEGEKYWLFHWLVSPEADHCWFGLQKQLKLQLQLSETRQNRCFLQMTVDLVTVEGCFVRGSSLEENLFEYPLDDQVFHDDDGDEVLEASDPKEWVRLHQLFWATGLSSKVVIFVM